MSILLRRFLLGSFGFGRAAIGGGGGASTAGEPIGLLLALTKAS